MAIAAQASPGLSDEPLTYPSSSSSSTPPSTLSSPSLSLSSFSSSSSSSFPTYPDVTDLLVGLISNYSTNSNFIIPIPSSPSWSSSPSSILTVSSTPIFVNESEVIKIEEEKCASLVPHSYDLWISSVCALWSILGIIYIFYGYRCFKLVMFLSGFIMTTSLVYTFTYTRDLMPIHENLLLSASAGLLIGLITCLFSYVGIFVIGFNFGCFLGTAIILFIHLVSPYVEDISPPNSAWIIFVLITGWSLIGAFSALYFQKGCTILYTCIYGSTFIILSVDYFVESFYLFNWILNQVREDSSLYSTNTLLVTQHLCLISWILITLWPVLILIGLISQWCGTGKNYYHINLLSHESSRRNGQLNLLRIRKEEDKMEQKQKKYRYLYQVRTAHGDVISQQYLQNFQKKKSPHFDRESLRTINSDLSHLTGYNPSESQTTTMSHVP